jgi:hypothetical protein
VLLDCGPRKSSVGKWCRAALRPQHSLIRATKFAPLEEYGRVEKILTMAESTPSTQMREGSEEDERTSVPHICMLRFAYRTSMSVYGISCSSIRAANSTRETTARSTRLSSEGSVLGGVE